LDFHDCLWSLVLLLTSQSPHRRKGFTRTVCPLSGSQ
jgi:hypothetical protein